MSAAVINLGAGVQSSTLLLMAAAGKFEPAPELAVFADTGWEPAAVYEQLAWLEEEVAGTIEVVRVSAGNLRDDLLSFAARITPTSTTAFVRCLTCTARRSCTTPPAAR